MGRSASWGICMGRTWGGKERGTVTQDLTEVYEGMDDPYINWSLIILAPIPHMPHEV